MHENVDRKPRLQFGIRTLLVLILLASLPLAWLAYDVSKSRQRHAVEREWNRRGAQVVFAADRRIIALSYRLETATQISDEKAYLFEGNTPFATFVPSGHRNIRQWFSASSAA